MNTEQPSISVTDALARIREIKANEAIAEEARNESCYQTIRVPNHMIPPGAKLVEAYETEGEVIVMGQPPEWDDAKPEELQHNCDMMGCGSCAHVLYRFKKG